jgi:hypothetical protein
MSEVGIAARIVPYAAQPLEIRKTSVVNDWLEAIDLVLLRPTVLSRAGEPMPTPLGTLDALHLATAHMARPHGTAADDGHARHRARLGGASTWVRRPRNRLIRHTPRISQ